jgi:hypothetical protein
MSNKHNNTVYLTPDGLKKVEEELEYLITTRRQEVAQMIAEAKAEGDISENAGYDEAKNAQGFLEGRILELQRVLKHAEIIKESDGPAHGRSDNSGPAQVPSGSPDNGPEYAAAIQWKTRNQVEES